MVVAVSERLRGRQAGLDEPGQLPCVLPEAREDRVVQ